LKKNALIFPGQGAQAVGMGRDFAEQYACAKQVYDRADELLDFPLSRLCFEGPAEELEKTDIQQPAIFVTGVAIWQVLTSEGVDLNAFSFAGGLSLGEYTALHVAGVFSFDDALRLVRRRGQLMQQAAEASPSGMISLIGADEASATALCDRARGDDVLVPANFNCPGQVVIAGSKSACDRAMSMLGELGLRGVQLAVAGAFHSPLMAPAAQGLEAVLKETGVSLPRIPVLANVNAGYHGDADAVRESLRMQVTHPVRWQLCVERMIADGAERFVEIGPGRVLTGLMRKINRSVETLNVSTADTVASIVSALSDS
jgi:[acyl-carrier-protein] S-malonyltransferase